MNNDHAELATIEFGARERERAIECADIVFGWFTDWVNELLAYALAQNGQKIAA